MIGTFYVYVLFRPNGVPCYVGKGRLFRWLEHERLAGRHCNKHLGRIIVKAGGRIPKVKVRENLSEVDALETEIALIAAIGRGKNGPLVNLTDGGDGVSGFVPTAKQRAAHKEKMNNPEVRSKLSQSLTGNTINKGRRHTPIAKANMSDGGKGKVLSESHKSAIRAAMSRHDVVEKMSVSHSGKKHKDVTLAKMREAQIARRAREATQWQ